MSVFAVYRIENGHVSRIARFDSQECAYNYCNALNNDAGHDGKWFFVVGTGPAGSVVSDGVREYVTDNRGNEV